MKHPIELSREASTNRDLARRARRLARRRSVVRDRERLERFATELDDHASELEAEADRAKAARKLAAELCNPAARADMLNVAEAYDRMARRAAERSAGSARESESN